MVVGSLLQFAARGACWLALHCKCGLALPVVQHSMHQEMSPIGVIT
jgi:hypothetical protein